MDLLNAAVGLTSLAMGALAIWLSIHFYGKAKDAEKQVAVLLESIRTQAESLQKLTGRWMDRFTRHATEPKPMDDGLRTLVSTVADLPTAILATLRITPGADGAQVEPLRTELIDSYLGLHYYTGIANVALQSHLPDAADYDESDETHVAIRRLVDASAVDFNYMAQQINSVDSARVRASRLHHLLQEANTNWAPLVRSADLAFRAKEGEKG
jgi:hypothetical protein